MRVTEGEAIVVSVHGSAVLLSDGQHEYTAALPAELAGDVVVGDRAFTEQGEGPTVVRCLAPRQSTFSRLDGDFTRHGGGFREQIIAANIDQVIVVVTAKQPPFRPKQLDRYLVLAERNELHATIALNKVDLGDVDLSEFERLGYPVIRTSRPAGVGRADLMAALAGRASVFTGSSGVGKTTLLSWVLGQDLVTGAVSRKGERGRHTTTVALVRSVPGGGIVIDTPGIRALELMHITPAELDGYFPEIAAVVDGCRFRDCSHLVEPGCAVRELVETGDIAERRFRHYESLLRRSRGRHR